MSSDDEIAKAPPALLSRFTLPARTALQSAETIARAAGRRSPLAEEVILAVLAVDLGGEPLAAIVRDLDHYDPERLAVRLRLAIELPAERSLAELDATYDDFLRAAAARRWPADCAQLLDTLLDTAYLGRLGRLIMAQVGLTHQTLLPAVTPERRRQPAAARPPFGRQIEAGTVPSLIGRRRLSAHIAKRFAAGLPTIVCGPHGVGKSVVARTAAARSGRLAVEISLTELAMVEVGERTRRLAALLRYLHLHGGGLIITDVTSGSVELLRAALAGAAVPLIVATDEALSAVAIPALRQAARVRVTVPTRAQVRATLVDWAAADGHPRIDEPSLAAALRLSEEFFGDLAMTPGTVIDLIRGAALSAPAEPVTAEGLERAVALVTGLPQAVVSAAVRARLNTLEDRLRRRIVGQTEAITAVVSAIRRRAVALDAKARPAGVFLFVGPTGVGKTELGRAIAMEHYGDESAFIRYDMGNFQHSHEIAKLIGSPPGYVGSDKPGHLIRDLLARPSSVLVFDEIERADPAVQDFLMAALDAGLITGNKGEKVSLADVVVIMTSNLGSRAKRYVRGPVGFGADQGNAIDARLAQARQSAISDHFAPEFLNRIDAIVPFESLTQTHLSAILDLMVATFGEYLARRYRVTLSLGDGLRAKILADIAAQDLGARPLERRFRAEVMDRFADTLLDGGYRAGRHYHLDVGQTGSVVVHGPASPKRTS